MFQFKLRSDQRTAVIRLLLWHGASHYSCDVRIFTLPHDVLLTVVTTQMVRFVIRQLISLRLTGGCELPESMGIRLPGDAAPVLLS